MISKGEKEKQRKDLNKFIEQNVQGINKKGLIPGRIRVSIPSDSVHKILDIIQAVSIPPNQKRGIIRDNIKNLISGITRDFHLKFKPKLSKHARQSFLRIINRVCHRA